MEMTGEYSSRIVLLTPHIPSPKKKKTQRKINTINPSYLGPVTVFFQ